MRHKVNKYGARKTLYKNVWYDSKREASYAHDLDMRIMGKDIHRWERQIKIPFSINGEHIYNHYVDFLIIHNDGSPELVEVKGHETALWKIKKKILKATYLKEHPEYIYTVVK
jgi:hypothetical protein